MKRKGFTLIELLVVIAIIGLLSSLAVVSLNSAREKARDARRVSDVRQLATLIEMENTGGAAAIAGCVLADAIASTCTGPGAISQFSDFSDPTGTAACTVTSADVCDYSVSQDDGSAAATTADYQICFYLESGAGDLSAGRNSVTTGAQMTAGCL